MEEKTFEITIPVFFLTYNSPLEKYQALILYEVILISHGSGELGIS